MGTDNRPGAASPPPAGAPNNSPSDAPSPDEIALMRPTLHAAGVSTAGMSDADVAAAYQSHRAKQEAQREAECTARHNESAERLRIARERLLGDASARVARMRQELARDGIAVDGLSDDEVIARCAERRREQQRIAEQQAAAVARRQRAEQLFVQAKCPPRHVQNLDVAHADDNRRWKSTRDLLVDRLDDAYLIALLGTRGGGKTQLAVSVIHHACQRGLVCRYVKRLDLSRMVRRTYSAGPPQRGAPAETEDTVVDKLVALDLLVIDECHQVTDSDFDRTLLVNILDRRYDEMRATVLISNDDKAAFAASVGDSVVSRIHESGECIECVWPTYRKPRTWREASRVVPS